MTIWSRRKRWVALVLAVGCTSKGGNEGDGSSSGSTAAETAAASETTETSETSAASETTETSETSATTAEPAICEGNADYTATAEVLDEGLGPTGAPVTITNCTDAVAYVYQDCCYGPLSQLERKDTADDPWRVSTPSFACDCNGPLEPLVIEPSASIVVDTDPPSYDSEPICEDPYVAIYRWTFLVGAEPDCTDCWESVQTNEFSWYCEG